MHLILSITMIHALIGFSGSGKDTAGNIIASFALSEGKTVKKMSFGAKLKDVVSILFGYPRDMLEGNTPESRVWRETIDPVWEKLLGISQFTPRMALQLIGTDLFRNHFHQDIWVIALQQEIVECKADLIVITDVRFPNEIDMLKELGAKFIYIERAPKPIWFSEVCRQDYTNVPKDIHKSELLWIEKFDRLSAFEITNYGSKAALRNQLGMMVQSWQHS